MPSRRRRGNGNARSEAIKAARQRQQESTTASNNNNNNNNNNSNHQLGEQAIHSQESISLSPVQLQLQLQPTISPSPLPTMPTCGPVVPDTSAGPSTAGSNNNINNNNHHHHYHGTQQGIQQLQDQQHHQHHHVQHYRDQQDVLDNYIQDACMHCHSTSVDAKVRCEECHAYICENCHWCHEFQANHEIRVCDRCDAFYCRNCDEMDQCDDCGEVVCASCCTLLSCKFCGGGLCEDCATACGRCGIVLCSRDAKFAVDCDTCRLSYCLVCLASGSKDPCVRCGHRPSKRVEQLVHLRLKSIYKAFKQSSSNSNSAATARNTKRPPSSTSSNNPSVSSADAQYRLAEKGPTIEELEDEILTSGPSAESLYMSSEGMAISPSKPSHSFHIHDPYEYHHHHHDGDDGCGNDADYDYDCDEDDGVRVRTMEEKQQEADAAAEALLAELDEEEAAKLKKAKKKKKKKKAQKQTTAAAAAKDTAESATDTLEVGSATALADTRTKATTGTTSFQQLASATTSTKTMTTTIDMSTDKKVNPTPPLQDSKIQAHTHKAEANPPSTEPIPPTMNVAPASAILPTESDTKVNNDRELPLDSDPDPIERRLCSCVEQEDVNGIETILLELKGVPGRAALRKNAKKALKRLQCPTQPSSSNAAKADAPPLDVPMEGTNPPTLLSDTMKHPKDDLVDLLRIVSHEFIPGKQPNHSECVLQMSPVVVGWVIGKGGQRIRDLMEESGAKIWIDQETPNPEEQRLVYISGDRQCVDKGIEMVYDVVSRAPLEGPKPSAKGPTPPQETSIAKKECPLPMSETQLLGGPCLPNASTDVGDDSEVQVLTCEPRYVPLLIGKRGWAIKDIQDKSGARVDIDQTVNPRQIRISGSPECVAKAIPMVRSVLSYPHAQPQPSQTDEFLSDHQAVPNIPLADPPSELKSEEKPPQSPPSTYIMTGDAKSMISACSSLSTTPEPSMASSHLKTIHSTGLAMPQPADMGVTGLGGGNYYSTSFLGGGDRANALPPSHRPPPPRPQPQPPHALFPSGNLMNRSLGPGMGTILSQNGPEGMYHQAPPSQPRTEQMHPLPSGLASIPISHRHPTNDMRPSSFGPMDSTPPAGNPPYGMTNGPVPPNSNGFFNTMGAPSMQGHPVPPSLPSNGLVPPRPTNGPWDFPSGESSPFPPGLSLPDDVLHNPNTARSDSAGGNNLLRPSLGPPGVIQGENPARSRIADVIHGTQFAGSTGAFGHAEPLADGMAELPRNPHVGGVNPELENLNLPGLPPASSSAREDARIIESLFGPASASSPADGELSMGLLPNIAGLSLDNGNSNGALWETNEAIPSWYAGSSGLIPEPGMGRNGTTRGLDTSVLSMLSPQSGSDHMNPRGNVVPQHTAQESRLHWGSSNA
eukprot:Nitzschia sp. Nitz4//scaffold273_size25297//16228//20551//NITZ4_008320-RA/size25297-snap-gene-0.5-mRNA-1//1//CDS//3329545259//6133//frame0